MALSHRIPLLTRLMPALLLVILTALPGCGLLFDAVQHFYPVTTNELDRICQRGQIQIGMAVEPFQPFVFPAVWTDEGARVTGLDAELIRIMSDALSTQCGTPVVPALHLVRFRDLFLLLNEGRLDLFVSAVANGTPAPERSGFAYSTPYFSPGGIGAIVKRPEIQALVEARLREHPEGAFRHTLLDGLTVAVQDSTAAHLYVAANVLAGRLLLCDSLPAAFEHAASGASPTIDAILGAAPVLTFMTKTTRKDWRVLTNDTAQPLRFMSADYAVVTAEESYRLRWFLNRVIFELDESGRLRAMRHRWLEESYAYPRRASTEGLAFDVQDMPAHYAQGTCRVSSGPVTH